MPSVSKTGFAAFAALVVQAAAILTMPAAVSPASAEMLSFWEDEKPNVTGASRSAGKKRLPAEYAGSDGDDDQPVARPARKKRAVAAADSASDEPVPRKKKRSAAVAESADDEQVPAKKQRKVRVASLGGDDQYDPRPSRKSLSGGGNVTWAASSGCLNGTLTSIVQDVASAYGALTVSSTCRDRGHNAAVGGAPKSQHLTGNAVDFRVHGNVSGAMAFLRNHGSVGGFHHYGGGLFHIDTGPKRTW
jgi:hypothetical protein